MTAAYFFKSLWCELRATSVRIRRGIYGISMGATIAEVTQIKRQKCKDLAWRFKEHTYSDRFFWSDGFDQGIEAARNLLPGSCSDCTFWKRLENNKGLCRWATAPQRDGYHTGHPMCNAMITDGDFGCKAFEKRRKAPQPQGPASVGGKDKSTQPQPVGA